MHDRRAPSALTASIHIHVAAACCTAALLAPEMGDSHRHPCRCEGGVALITLLPASGACSCASSKLGISITVCAASGRLPAVTEFNLEAGKLDAEADTKDSGLLAAASGS